METLTLPGNLTSLSPIGKYVMETAKEASLDKRAAYKLRLAIDEVATNIIVHGYQEHDLEGDIKIKSDLQDDQLKITLEDTAVAYDPTKQQEEIDVDVPIEERKIGGLGVFLAFDGVDKFLYERDGNINRNILIVELS